MDKISIIVPIYNSETTLNACIGALLNQTYRNLDIILVDDGSADESGKICDKFAAIDSRIRVLHKENGGVVSARNAGIRMISEDGYTTFCDSDDRMASDAIEKLYLYGISTKADLVCGNLQKFFAHSIKLKKSVPPSLSAKRCYDKEEIYSEILPSFFGITDFPGYMPTKLYKNSLLKQSLDFQYPTLKFQEDMAINLLIVLKAEKIAVMPDVIYFYRIGGVTSRYMPTFLDDCISLYNFKISVIADNKLPKSMSYTTAIELKNECSFWLQMQFDYIHGEKHREKMLDEIKRCCHIPEIVEAVNCPKDDKSGISGFGNMVKNIQYDEIFNLLAEQAKKSRIKKEMKRLLAKL